MDQAQYAAICEHFQQYYKVFDTNRQELGQYYHETSLLCFESKGNEIIQGRDAIVQKLVQLPFQRVAHAVTTCDVQPTSDGALIIVVNGLLQTDDDPKMPFTQTFLLRNSPQGMFIANDIFRLGVHNF